MKIKEIKKMKTVIDEVLKAGQHFYDIFGKTYSSGVIGELLVTKRILEKYERELTSDNNCNIEFKGNCIQKFDIFLNLKELKFKINAKATTTQENGKPKWVRQHAKNYATIKNKNKKTLCSPRTDYDESLFYVFVDVKRWLDQSKAEFYILSDSDAKKTFGKKYSKKYNGKTIRTNESDDMWTEYKDIKKFKDNNLKRFKKELEENCKNLKKNESKLTDTGKIARL
ncbi:MAG: hypothetical protein WA240_11390 [Nitrospirota bacterium]